MPRYNFGNTPGAGDANSTYTSDFFYYVTTLPTGRQAANGQHPIIVTGLEAVMNGYRASRRVNFTIADESGAFASGSALTITGATSAASSVYGAAAYKGFTEGGIGNQKARVTVDSDGLFYVGRNSRGPGSVVGNGGLVRAGSLAGGFYYVQSPTAPSTPAVTPKADGTGAYVKITAPGDTGETAITGYRLRWATSPDMKQNVRQFDVPLSSEIIGLNPGTTYYWQAIARNAVTDWAGAVGGQWSGISSARQPSPSGGLMVSNGKAYVPAQLMVSNGVAYVPAKLMVSNGQSWVDAK